MGEETRLLLSFVVACAATLLLAPIAIRVARRTGFFDHPAGYKGHEQPTPYLGGTAVVGGLLLAGLLFGSGGSDLLAIALGVVAMLLLGTVDDRFGLGPWIRIATVIGAGALLFETGVGWSVFTSDAPNLALTIVFVLGVVNAYNLMDNIDGAAGIVSGITGAVLGTLAAAEGDAALAALAFAMAGACAGFLRFNLARPARIFLGDGGSMPLGFCVAGIVMALPASGQLGWALIPVAVVMVGLPALDTALVIISRVRRGAGVMTGGRDHLTHRLLFRLGSPRRVALALAGAQAALCGSGALLFDLARSEALLGSLALILLGTVAVAVLESPRWFGSLREGPA